MNLEQNDIKLDGVLFTNDSINQHLSLFKNTTPVPHTLEKVIPNTTSEFLAISYNNWEVYEKNLALFYSEKQADFQSKRDSLFSSFDEIGRILLNEEPILIAHSKDITITDLELANSSSERAFRQVEILSLNKSTEIQQAFKVAFPILTIPKIPYYCKLDNFYIFSETKTGLETLIANFQNNSTLATDKAFRSIFSRLSSASSILYIQNLNKKAFASWSRSTTHKELTQMDLSLIHI